MSATIDCVSFFGAIERLVRLFFPRIDVDCRGVEIHEPAIFVANHADSFGPLALHLYFPVKLYPWVIHNVTDMATCARYLEQDFVARELHLRRPFSAWLSILMARICVGLFRHIEAIPVYHDSRRILETISKSIIYLEEGRNILIFPEIPDSYLSAYIRRFNTGFIEITKTLGRENGMKVPIYPVSVDPRRRRILLGKPSAYDPSKSHAEEKLRIQAELEAEVASLLALP